MKEEEGNTLLRFIASVFVTAALGVLAIFGVLIITTIAAYSQGLPHSPAGQHDKYGGIRNKAGQLCCNRNDCKKIIKEEEVKILREGGYTVKASGEHVDEEKVADSPDGEWHICRDYATSSKGFYEPTGKVRCLMIPQGGF
jgi:hypothetical protein